MALLRFSLIAPILNKTITSSIKDYLETICARPYQIPGIGFRELSPKTLRHWLLEYRRHGLEGLKRKSRNDKGFDQLGSVPGQFMQFSIVHRRNKARSNQAYSMELGKPPGIPGVRFIAWKGFSIPWISQSNFEMVFKKIIDRDPVLPCTFHSNLPAFILEKPILS